MQPTIEDRVLFSRTVKSLKCGHFRPDKSRYSKRVDLNIVPKPTYTLPSRPSTHHCSLRETKGQASYLRTSSRPF
ncbi:hypothetical protein RRG08_052452 [Elysia crispata]|uniref:Uncharacterized protein n=1 Tax=Elysia crispata TaxID=231223 RepID=A0AAE1B1I1_9GAST|nr:hypothetical protein RRG08_052452 [Elysia crispata]